VTDRLIVPKLWQIPEKCLKLFLMPYQGKPYFRPERGVGNASFSFWGLLAKAISYARNRKEKKKGLRHGKVASAKRLAEVRHWNRDYKA
jgi:hypothetical protein